MITYMSDCILFILHSNNFIKLANKQIYVKLFFAKYFCILYIYILKEFYVKIKKWDFSKWSENARTNFQTSSRRKIDSTQCKLYTQFTLRVKQIKLSSGLSPFIQFYFLWIIFVAPYIHLYFLLSFKKSLLKMRKEFFFVIECSVETRLIPRLYSRHLTSKIFEYFLPCLTSKVSLNVDTYIYF